MSDGFVVKIVNSIGLSMWLAPSQFGGHAFGPRESAQIFHTKLEARAAINELPSSFHGSGFKFTVEAAE
jgi:hypothetical protein